MSAGRALLYVADSHLTEDDPEVDAFIAFLRGPGREAGTLYILGDLFNVWFAEKKFRRPHQQRVLDALADLAARGVVVKFVEGNRDYSVRRNHLGHPFRDVAGEIIEEHAGRRILAAHGDEVNRADRQYRLWKRFSRSFAVYGLFRLLPGSFGVRLGETLERKLSGTNMRHKSRFPSEECAAWAGSLFPRTCDTIVLGHFHDDGAGRFLDFTG
jgi:UDP-2,3-diacylglucosamine hydrolase